MVTKKYNTVSHVGYRYDLEFKATVPTVWYGVYRTVTVDPFGNSRL